MYGLKQVPFKLKTVALKKPVPFKLARCPGPRELA
jgi:hypothetical protein